MSEESVQIPLSDNKRAYGRLRIVPNAPLVVLVHGLTAEMNDHLHFNGSRFFEEHGYSSLRFDLYDDQPDARNLRDCTTSTHAQDLDDILRWSKKTLGVTKIGVCGHSLGFIVATLAKEPFDALVGWDGTYASHLSAFETASYEKSFGAYRWNRSVEMLLGKEMIEELHNLDSGALIKASRIPTLLISSNDEDRENQANLYFKEANEPKRTIVIPSSDHDFTFEGNNDHLYNETLDWFNQYLPA